MCSVSLHDCCHSCPLQLTGSWKEHWALADRQSGDGVLYTCCVQGSARKMGPWDDEEAAALTREVQRYMEAKQGAKAQRAAVAGQVCLSVTFSLSGGPASCWPCLNEQHPAFSLPAPLPHLS